MDSCERNNNCWGNARISPSSTIISSRKVQYRNGDLNLRFKQTAQSNTTSFNTNSALGFHPKAVVKKIYIEIPASSNSDVLTELTTSTNMYETISPTQIQPKQVSVVLSTNSIEQTSSQLVPGDLPKLSPPELLSLEKFHWEQSLLPYNHTLIVVPESVDFLQNNSVDTDLTRLSLIPPVTTLKILNKQNTNDVQSFISITRKIKSVPVPKFEVAPKSVNVSNRVKADSTKIIKKPSVPQKTVIKKEDLRSVESTPLVLPIQSKQTTDNNTSRVVVRQSQSSSLNKHSSKKQQPSPSPPKRVAETKKPVITSASKLPVKKSVPTVIHKKMETEFPWDNFDNNENGADTCKFGFNIFLH